jgi:high frequency lysogenization protein
VFRIDAPSVVGVYGNVSGVRLGLRTLIAQMDDNGRDMAVTRMAVTVMRLERSLSGRRDLLDQLQQGIVAAQRQVDHFGQGSPQVIGRLAAVYSSTLSTLRPRVMVTGNPQLLRQAAIVERIRASLLAAVRSAVLWRQVGGRQWQFLLNRRQCGMLARGLLTGTTLDNGKG